MRRLKLLYFQLGYRIAVPFWLGKSTLWINLRVGTVDLGSLFDKMDGRRKRLKAVARIVPGRAIIKSENINEEVNNFTNGINGLETCVKFETHDQLPEENETEVDAFTLFDIKHPTISSNTDHQTAESSTVQPSQVKFEHGQACTFMPAEVTDDVDPEIAINSHGNQDSEVKNVCYEGGKSFSLEDNKNDGADGQNFWKSALKPRDRKLKRVSVGKLVYQRQPKSKEQKTTTPGGTRVLRERRKITSTRKQKNYSSDPATDENSRGKDSNQHLTDTSTIGVLDDDNSHGNTRSFQNYGQRRRRKFCAMWSSEDNEQFYDALRTYGTDFSLMEAAFGGRRTRRELKAKFNLEDKRDPEFISKCLFPQSEQYSSALPDPEEADFVTRLLHKNF